MLAKQWRFSSQHSLTTRADNAEELFSVLHQLQVTDLVLDVEPWLVHWRESAAVLPSRVAAWKAQLPPCRLTLCSNSQRFARVATTARMVSNARKPWTPVTTIGRLGPRPVVAGDLLILDGLLAWRLDAHFVWMRWPRSAPLWPALLRSVDWVTEPLLLKSSKGVSR